MAWTWRLVHYREVVGFGLLGNWDMPRLFRVTLKALHQKH